MNSCVSAFWTPNWNADGSTCTIEKSFLAMEVETDKWFIWNRSSTLKKTITKTIMRKMREIMPPVMERYEVWPLNLIYVGYGSLSKLFMIEPNPIGYIINIFIETTMLDWCLWVSYIRHSWFNGILPYNKIHKKHIYSIPEINHQFIVFLFLISSSWSDDSTIGLLSSSSRLSSWEILVLISFRSSYRSSSSLFSSQRMQER